MDTQSTSPRLLNFAKTLSQILLLVLIWWLGSKIQTWFHLPISGGVIGLLLLLAALFSGLFKMSWIKQGSDLILAELVLFFIPCVVGIVKYKNLLLSSGWQLVIAVVVGTICVMVFTALTVYFGFKLERKLSNKKTPSAEHSDINTVGKTL